MKRSGILLIALGVVLAATVTWAGDWQKIGSATLVFKNPTVEIKAKTGADPCSQVRLSITGDMVRATSLTFYFTDGTKQEVELDAVLRPGIPSDPIAIEGGPKQVDHLELAHRANGGSGSRRAQITAQATS